MTTSVIHRGAFTGAVESFRGVIRAAEGGTPLLRFLDSKELHPLGEATPQRVAVRVVAATNADLERMMKEGRFREDLYHRLNVVHVRVPRSRSVIQNRDLSRKFIEERETPPPA